jgi:hypothetical protein
MIVPEDQIPKSYRGDVRKANAVLGLTEFDTDVYLQEDALEKLRRDLKKANGEPLAHSTFATRMGQIGSILNRNGFTKH